MAKIVTKADRENDLTIRTATGEITAAEIIKVIEAYYSGKSTRLILWDFQQASFSKIRSQDIRRIVDVMKRSAKSRKSGKTAFVFASVEGYGLGRMYEILLEIQKSPVSRSVFKDRLKALQWLGVSE